MEPRRAASSPSSFWRYLNPYHWWIRRPSLVLFSSWGSALTECLNDDDDSSECFEDCSDLVITMETTEQPADKTAAPASDGSSSAAAAAWDRREYMQRGKLASLTEGESSFEIYEEDSDYEYATDSDFIDTDSDSGDDGGAPGSACDGGACTAQGPPPAPLQVAPSSFQGGEAASGAPAAQTIPFISPVKTVIEPPEDDEASSPVPDRHAARSHRPSPSPRVVLTQPTEQTIDPREAFRQLQSIQLPGQPPQPQKAAVESVPHVAEVAVASSAAPEAVKLTGDAADGAIPKNTSEEVPQLPQLPKPASCSQLSSLTAPSASSTRRRASDCASGGAGPSSSADMPPVCDASICPRRRIAASIACI